MAEVADLHIPFRKHLKEQGIEHVYARPDKKSTVETGWPDFTLIHPNRGPLLIEFKQEKNSYLSAEQKSVHDRLKQAGFRPLVVRSLQAALDVVAEWQATIPVVPASGPEQLYRYGQSVFRKGPNGIADFVRIASGQDMQLPMLGNNW